MISLFHYSFLFIYICINIIAVKQLIVINHLYVYMRLTVIHVQVHLNN